MRSEAICLAIHPWSQTSHVVTWLTPTGIVSSVVKGAVRPKSFFLGQYDLNYTCDVVYYERSRGDLHALRECSPLRRRDALRDDFRALALAGYCRRLALDYAPEGPDCGAWFDLLERLLDDLATPRDDAPSFVAQLVGFELAVLHLMGLAPELEAQEGAFHLRGERAIPVSAEVAAYLKAPLEKIENSKIPLDAARVIGVFYHFHLDCAVDTRRSVLAMIS